MDYGMPTLIETKTLNECAMLCHELGLRFIELNMNLPQYQPDKIDIAYFTETAKKYGIYYTIHLDENLNVSDFNTRVADAYRQTVVEAIALAKKLSVFLINMHLSRGVYFTLPEKRVYLFDEYKDTYLTEMKTFRDECEKLIGETNIIICIENCDGYADFQKEALSLMLESPVFGLAFDIGHNHVIGGVDEPVIMEHADRLCHMHMHDAIGVKNHLALGTGEIDLQKYVVVAAEHNCRVVLETKTIEELKESVDWIKKRGVM